jgi:diketogulonate reductase-like aldo/keto reductase
MRIPKLVYGTAWKKSDTSRLVESALRTGFRAIDTACQPKHYNEPGVGAGIAACLGDSLKRTDLYLQTKFTAPSGQDPQSIPYDANASPAVQVAQSFAASLRNLQTDYVDCLVLHSPIMDRRQSDEVWRAMESLVDSAGVRQLGISNCYDVDYLKNLHRNARIKPAVVQNRFYAQTGYDKDIRAFCRQSGIVYQSFWTLSANPQLLADEIIVDIARKYRRSAAQVLFRYLTQQDVVPLTGTQSLTHMRESLAVFEFALTDDECVAITDLL